MHRSMGAADLERKEAPILLGAVFSASLVTIPSVKQNAETRRMKMMNR